MRGADSANHRGECMTDGRDYGYLSVQLRYLGFS